MNNLDDIRKEIDDIDNKIVELYKQRMHCTKSVALYKKEHNIPVFSPHREEQILNDIEEKGGEFGHSARLLYSNIMVLSRAMQHNIVASGSKMRSLLENAPSDFYRDNLKIACQGIKGANSHEAANKVFKNYKPLFCENFSDVFEAVDNSTADYGILPVENSNAGSVSTVYDLLLKHRFYIIKALGVKIENCLCGLSQSILSDIDQVWSHPQALAQCSKYIKEKNLKAIPLANTAVAAREIAKEKRLNCAAICSIGAAREYGLKVLDEHFQNSETNTTRFILISKSLYIPQKADKISLCFSLPHVTGSLYNVLSRFNSLGLNLTKIESRPILSKNFEYLFYLDFSGNVYNKDVKNLICALSEELPEFSFMGNYTEKIVF